MPHTSTLVQSGEELFVVTEDGGSMELTLPSTITLTDARIPRFEVSGVHAVMANTPTQPIIVDDNGIVMPLSPTAPTAAPTVAVGAAGALTGTYGVKYTFAIRNLDEVIIAESGFSASASVALTADKLAVSVIQVMSGLVTADIEDRYEIVRRLYRTTAGGSVYFLWHTIEDNTTTTYSGDESDASLGAIAADSLGTAPYLSHIASFRERLFGVDDSSNREKLLYSESGLRWAWPDDNFFTAPQVKGDSQSGITALIPRREALGIAKSNMLIQLTGTSDDDFRLVTLSTTIGATNQESVAIYRDQVYFLGQDGVYRWGDGGIDCVSDGKVRSWFTTDDYFDRTRFDEAFAIIDVLDKSYKLYLVTAGGETVDTWVELDLETGTWWGPHRTDAYTLTSGLTLSSHSPLAGEGTLDGYIVVDTETRSDDEDTAIEVEAITAPLVSSNPPVTTYWGELTTEIEPQAAGTLAVYPSVGELSEAEEAVFSHDLTTASVRLGRLGYGRFVKLRFYHNTIAQIVQLLGFELSPVNAVGRRQ